MFSRRQDAATGFFGIPGGFAISFDARTRAANDRYTRRVSPRRSMSRSIARVYEFLKPVLVTARSATRRGVSPSVDFVSEEAHLRSDTMPGIIPVRGVERSSGYGVGHGGGTPRLPAD